MTKHWPKLLITTLLVPASCYLSSCKTVKNSAESVSEPTRTALASRADKVSEIVFVSKYTTTSSSSPQVYYTALDPQPFPEAERQKLLKIIQSDSAWRNLKPGPGIASIALQRFILFSPKGKALCVCTQTTEKSTIQIRPINRQTQDRFFPGPNSSYANIQSVDFTRELINQMTVHQSVKVSKLRADYHKLGADFDTMVH